MSAASRNLAGGYTFATPSAHALSQQHDGNGLDPDRNHQVMTLMNDQDRNDQDKLHLTLGRMTACPMFEGLPMTAHAKRVIVGVRQAVTALEIGLIAGVLVLTMLVGFNFLGRKTQTQFNVLASKLNAT